MKISIIGFGVVGKAQAFLMRSLGHEVYAYDIRPPKEECTYAYVLKEPFPNPDVTFICVPEHYVEDAVKTLLEKDSNDFYVIKSTVPPPTTRNLMAKYDVHLCHNPEFLREGHSFEDALNPSRIVIGQCCPKHGKKLEELYKPLGAPIYITDTTTSELVKIITNSLRSIAITFWNQIDELARALGVDTHEVAGIVEQGKTLDVYEGGNWGTKFFGKPFGGKCLPKDLKHLIRVFEKYSVDTEMLKAVERYNTELALKVTSKAGVIA